jgi:hypothetical protein
MVHPQCLSFEKQNCEYGENKEIGYFLDHFQFNQRKRSTQFPVPDPVGRNLEKIFEQGDPPTHQDNAEKSEILKPVHFLEFQMTIPRQGHEHV